MFAHVSVPIPREVLTAIKHASEALRRGHTSDPYGVLDKGPIRAYLFQVQASRCAYCERKLSPSESQTVEQTHIEHFHPRNGVKTTSDCNYRSNTKKAENSDIAMDNLLLTCDGLVDDGTVETCDKAKKNNDICSAFYNPRLQHTDSLIRVQEDGRAVAKFFPGTSEEAQVVLDQVFNLNSERLRQNRNQIFVQYLLQYQKFKAKNRTGNGPKLRAKFCEQLRQLAQTADYPSTILSIAEFIESRAPKE